MSNQTEATGESESVWQHPLAVHRVRVKLERGPTGAWHGTTVDMKGFHLLESVFEEALLETPRIIESLLVAQRGLPEGTKLSLMRPTVEVEVWVTLVSQKAPSNDDRSDEPASSSSE